QILGILFLGAIYLTLARSVIYGFFAILQKRRERRAVYDATFLPPVSVILAQPNGGKSAALNNAIAHSAHEILIAVDADTLFRAGTIQKLVRHFKDTRVGAVSGNARVGNRRKWITRFQSIEYIYGFNPARRAFDFL